MKKVIVLVSLAIILIPFCEALALVDILYKSGGTLGDDGVTRYGEVVKIRLWLFSFTSCTGQGSSTCPENDIIEGADPDEMEKVNNAREYVRGKIYNNILTGYEELPNGLTVKWTSQTNNPQLCGECEIKIWTTGDPEPFPPNK